MHATDTDFSSHRLFQTLPQTFPALPGNKNKLTSYKALMIFHNDAPNSHVPAFLEFLVNALSTTSNSKSAKYTCKSHTASPGNSLYLLLINT